MAGRSNSGRLVGIRQTVAGELSHVLRLVAVTSGEVMEPQKLFQHIALNDSGSRYGPFARLL